LQRLQFLSHAYALTALAGFKGKGATNGTRRRPAQQHQGERAPAALAIAA